VTAQGSDEDTAEQVDRGARSSTVLHWSVRVGLVAYGLIHLLVAYVALRLVFAGHSSGSATGKGALSQLAGDTVGMIVLLLMAVGFAALLVWQLLTALVGYRDRDGLQRHLLRLGALCRAAVYGYLGGSAAALALGGQSASGRSPDSMTSSVMSAPGGEWIVVGVGLVVGGIGVGQIVFGLSKRFLNQLDDEAKNGERRIPIVLLGQVGYVVKGIAFITVGVLLGWAALSHDPKKSGGLDQALYRLLGDGLGGPAIVVVGLGIGCFGIYALLWSRHLDEESLTA
jgi:hypothetical protein